MNKLAVTDILLNQAPEDKYAAIRRVGSKLVEHGCVQSEYIQGMIERENSMSTYIGNGIAIPHGMLEYKKYIQKSGIVIAQYPQGVDFGDGKIANLVIGIAGIDDEHLEILSQIAIVCQEEENVRRLVEAKDAEEVLNILQQEV
jgi:mannitol PTS system EIIA component